MSLLRTVKMQSTTLKGDNDSGSGIDEKRIEAGEVAAATFRHGDMPADPDEGLSDAEKAAIVSLKCMSYGRVLC